MQPDPEAKNGSMRPIRRDPTSSTGTEIITKIDPEQGEGQYACRRQAEEQIRAEGM